MAMTDPLLPEHRFEQAVIGPAYRPGTRLVTIHLVIGLVAYGAWVLARRDGAVATPILWLMGLALLVVLSSAWFILTGKTTVDRTGIRQDWIFPKAYRWHEISRARFIKLPFSARLMLVTGHGPIRAVHSGNAALDDAFREIARFYTGAGRAA